MVIVGQLRKISVIARVFRLRKLGSDRDSRTIVNIYKPAKNRPPIAIAILTTILKIRTMYRKIVP
jgi:hypothetical protein